MTTAPTYTNRQLAEIAQVPLRVLERQIVVMQRGIPELEAALLEGRIKHGPAERIARLPKDRQMLALEAHLSGNRSASRPPVHTVSECMERISDLINAAVGNWSDRDRLLAVVVLNEYSRQLAGGAGETAVPA